MTAKTEWTVLAVLALVASGVVYKSATKPVPAADGSGPAAESRGLLNVITGRRPTPDRTPSDGSLLGPRDVLGDRIDEPAAPEAPVIEVASLSKGLPTEGHWRGNPEVADLNGDGHLDIVASIRRWDRDRPAEGLHVWLNDGEGGWTLSVEGIDPTMGYGGAAVSDVDGDGLLDIAFSTHDYAPRVFKGDGTGKWTALPASIEGGEVVSDVALGDFDGDGNVDMAALGFFGGGIEFHAGDGFGFFHLYGRAMENHNFGAEVTLTDVEGDGVPEVAAVTELGLKFWRYDTVQQDFVEVWQDEERAPAVGGTQVGLAFSDLDGDGVLEALVSGMSAPGHEPLTIWRLTDGRWTPWGAGWPTNDSFFDVEVARLGPDATPTIVAAGKYGLYVIDMVAPGQFESRGRVLDTEGGMNVDIGDFDGDGLDEVLYIGFKGVRVLDIPAKEQL